jgi:hypothetical protein
MMDSKEKDYSSETVRGVLFHGKDKSVWRKWSMKTLTIGPSKSWKSALLNNYEIAKLVEKVALAKAEQVKIDANQSAWTYLICKDEAFNIVTSVDDEDTFFAWKRLKEVFVPNQAKDLVGMNASFTNLGLEDEEEDPKISVTKLEHVNELCKSVDDKYKKDDLAMITQVFVQLPSTYATSVTSRKLLGIDNATLKEVKEELTNYWEQYI